MHTLADKLDRFSTSNLVGVLVNAADDMSQGKILDTANIKSIISGSPIRVEGKFKKGTTYVPFCKLIFGANHRLDSDDSTTGYLRRMMHIPFEKTFPPNPAKEAELHKTFNDPQELSGLFNEVRKRLKQTVNSGFVIPDMARDKIENYTPISDEDEKEVLSRIETCQEVVMAALGFDPEEDEEDEELEFEEDEDMPDVGEIELPGDEEGLQAVVETESPKS
jgi:hypothetical protein